MTSLSRDAFLYLVIFSMVAFIVGLGLVTFLERDSRLPAKRD